MSKGALVPVAKAPTGRRIVGRAIETNPLAAVVACVTKEHVDDLDLEITATENYLAGLKAMRQVAGVALGSGEPEIVTEVEPTQENDIDDDLPLKPSKPKGPLKVKNADDDPLLPPKTHPSRAAAELAVRKRIANFLHTNGMATRVAIQHKIGIGNRVISYLLTHPWFRQDADYWDLTDAGKIGGLDHVA